MNAAACAAKASRRARKRKLQRLAQFEGHREVHDRREAIVGGLRAVDVIVRMNGLARADAGGRAARSPDLR